MALISARALLKYGHVFTENLMFNVRSIGVSPLRYVNNTTTDQNKPQEAAQAEEGDAVNEDVEKFNKEIQQLTEKNTDLLDKYKRALADGENLRTRMTKQIADAKIFAIQTFCKDLLDVADVLGKATESVPQEEVTDDNPHLKSLYEGLVMTETQLQAIFKRHGLELVNPLNEKFNPNFHEALFQQEVKGKETGTVVVVSKFGYKLHERVIRPALVGVAK